MHTVARTKLGVYKDCDVGSLKPFLSIFSSRSGVPSTVIKSNLLIPRTTSQQMSIVCSIDVDCVCICYGRQGILKIKESSFSTPSVLIARLLNAHHHLIARRISEYVGMNQEVVILHWACSKITASLAIPDATLLEILLDKLKLCRGISYAVVAAHADKNGRRKLTVMLVQHEPRSSKQRPALELFGMIQARPLPRDLFISYARYDEHEFLKDFFLSTGQL